MKMSEDISKCRKRGRATLLNEQLQRKICGLLAQGHTVSAVCGAVGIGERTFYDWLQKHPHFSQATTRAIGKSKIVLVDKLRLSDDWRAAAFLLERRWPDEFGRAAERRLLEPPPPPPDLSRSIRFTCGGVDVGEYMRLKAELRVIEAELKAVGVLPEFPAVDGSGNTTPVEPESSDGPNGENGDKD